MGVFLSGLLLVECQTFEAIEESVRDRKKNNATGNYVKFGTVVPCRLYDLLLNMYELF